jgi:cellulose synthase/poly-beta-1,6-N-acetylglucosamine synthase-like glycosyltransferase
MTPNEYPFLTIVMPVRNEARFIQHTLNQLVAQDYPQDRYEIIVADGESTDETKALVKAYSQKYPQVILMDNPGRWPSSGRNVGFKNGQGDLFVVIDGHCYIPNDSYFKAVVRCFQISQADCLGRPQPLDPPALTLFQRAVSVARASRLGHGGDSLIYSSFEGFVSPVSNGFAYKKEVFQKIGWVDETFDACEDVEFNYRLEKAGLKCYMSPDLMVKYYPRDTFKGLFRQMSRYGQGRNKYVKKHPETLNLNLVLPALFVCGLMLFIISGLALPFIINSILLTPLVPFFFSLFFIYGLYSFIIMVESVRLGLKKSWAYVPLLPAIFYCVHVGLGYGFLKEAIIRKTR